MNMKVMITTDGKRGFFERGKEIAKLADQEKPIPKRCIINFNSPNEMIEILTKTRRNLMNSLRKEDASVTDLAKNYTVTVGR